MSLESVLAGLHANPSDHLGWLAIADCLEEMGEPQRAELARLSAQVRAMKSSGKRKRMEDRIIELLNADVRPCVPTMTNSIGMVFALIPPGVFLMGSPEDEEERSDDEQQHEVEISRPVYLGIHAVTQEQYQAVTGKNPSHFSPSGDGKEQVAGLDTRQFPVEQVSWKEVTAFCKKLSTLSAEKKRGLVYRLPSEAEWEYSCRGGASSSPFHFGPSLCSTQANFNGNYPYGGAEKGPYLERPCPVGSYPPNAFGLYDMHGNVWEWCTDWYDENYYKSSPRRDPSGPRGGAFRVIRGGSWISIGRICRSAYRGRLTPVYRSNYLGFRVAVPSGQ